VYDIITTKRTDHDLIVDWDWLLLKEFGLRNLIFLLFHMAFYLRGPLVCYIVHLWPLSFVSWLAVYM
jgi:hypothetical protein